MENVLNIAQVPAVAEEFEKHYQESDAKKFVAEQQAKKQSRLSKLLAYLANLETGFPLSGA